MAYQPQIENPPPNPTPNYLVESIRSMPYEFHFAASCLYTALNDDNDQENRNWTSSFNVPLPQGPPLFTEHIRRALLWLIAEDSSVYIQTVFQSWFVDNVVTRPLVKTLLDIMTAYCLQRAFSADDFLRHIAVMAELSALCFLAGLVETPDYTIGCILYIIRELDARGTLNWSGVDFSAEYLIRDAEDSAVHYQKMTHLRGSILRGYSTA